MPITCPKCGIEVESNLKLCDNCDLDLKKIAMLIQEGDSFLKKEKYQDAISCYEKAIKLGKKNAPAWCGKGNALFNQGKNSEDVKLCVKCHLCPVLSEAFYEDAIKCYDKAISIDPQLKEAWYGKGVTLDKLGKSMDAKECFEKARKLGYLDK